jgi:hypothetical protein
MQNAFHTIVTSLLLSRHSPLSPAALCYTIVASILECQSEEWNMVAESQHATRESHPCAAQVKEDPEWARFAQVPGLTDPWNDVRDKFNVATEEFKTLILDQV